jgi:4,5-dihydroxyphthalate decarboxylase
MVKVPITIACGNYDRTRAICDGRVRVEGCEVTCLPLYPEEIFFRAFRIRSSTSRNCPSRATSARWPSAPAPMWAFLLSSRGSFATPACYVRADAGIREPKDLKGKRIGVPEYQITAVVWMRGIMQHEYGVLPTDIHWCSGGQEEPGRDERTPLEPIPGLDLKPIDKEKTLVGMLRDGELDALFTARGPSSFLRGEPHIKRLFPNTCSPSNAFSRPVISTVTRRGGNGPETQSQSR